MEPETEEPKPWVSFSVAFTRMEEYPLAATKYFNLLKDAGIDVTADLDWRVLPKVETIKGGDDRPPIFRLTAKVCNR